MSSQLNVKKRVKYGPEQMARAIEAVRSGSLSKKAAAKAYGIPRTTLLDKLAGRVPEAFTHVGRKPVLTSAEELTLVNYAKLMFEIRYPMTTGEFLKEVKHVLDIDGRKTPFKNNLPGYHWFELFRKRNPEMSMRTPMGLGQERARVNMDMVNAWFEGVLKYLQSEISDYDKLLKNPRRVFNADESGFPLCAKANRVIAPKGVHNVYQVVTNTKVQITVMAAFNAFGDYVLPLILFPGERLRDISLSGFPEARYATTKSGWMDSETFVAFLEMLVTYCKEQQIEFPILLFVDGHSTHMSLAAAEFCRENKVILYCLLPNATHILQACDIGFFSPMKKVWQQTVKNWQLQNIGVAMSKKEFPGLFKLTWDRVATFENAAHGFRKSGLFPFTPKGVDTSKLGPARMEKEVSLPGNQNKQNVSRANESEIQEQCTKQTTSSQHEKDDQTRSNGNKKEETRSTENEKDEQTEVCVLPSGDQSSVSSAFLQLRIPKPVEKRKVQRLTEKLPKAISGTVAIKMLQEKEEKKKDEEAKKQKRKEEREQKRLQKLEEKAKRLEEKEKKRFERENAKHLNKKSKKRKRSKCVYDSSDSEDEMNSSALIDDASSDFEEEFEMCPGCNKGDQHPSRWAKCMDCGCRWHFMCANRPEFDLLDEEERKKMEFLCPLSI